LSQLALTTLIWEGGYVNIDNFIPKDDEEEVSSRLELVDGVLVKQSYTKKLKNIFEWAYDKQLRVLISKFPSRCWSIIDHNISVTPTNVPS
jgi:hypothetical protein